MARSAELSLRVRAQLRFAKPAWQWLPQGWHEALLAPLQDGDSSTSALARAPDADAGTSLRRHKQSGA
jgi:hypothetical protein